MTISLTCLRPCRKSVSFASLALALTVSGSINTLLLVCTPARALAQNSEIKNNFGDENNVTRPRRIDSAERVGPEGPLVRVGLLIDVAAVSLSSGSELIVHRAQPDDRESYTIASGELRVEARRIIAPALAEQKTPSKSDIKSVATGDANKYKPRSRYTEATSKDAINKKAEKANSSLEKANTSLISHVVAFESNQTVASSERQLIVTASDDTALRAKKDSEAEKGASGAVASRPVPAVRVGNKDYRGEIHLVLNSRGRINVINQLPLEQYLRGVVPRELPPAAFPQIEALKAQAVAARSYALATLGRFRNEGFDLRDDAQSQVYDGLQAEHPLTNRAVEETRGLVVVYKDEDGHTVPIEALYTSTCGGRTENNEAIFLTKPVPYLRSVECAPDRTAPANREIISDQMADAFSGPEGQLSRDVALLEVLGFSMPRPVTIKYLRGAVDEDELMEWMERAASLAQKGMPQRSKSRATSLPAFASLIASALYGDGRASMLLSPADIDYILAGMGGEEVPRDMRADLAMLLKDGVLRVSADSRLDARAPVTRAYAIETLVRALCFKVHIPGLKTQTARPAENGRLMVAIPKAAADARTKDQSAAASAKRATGRDTEKDGIEIERKAWLFRRFGDLSYAVDRLMLVGGERITYHTDAAGRVDFLEAEISDRGASSDRLSGQAQWRERILVDDLRRRLGRARVSVGEIENLAPITYGDSNRVLEMEVIGAEGRARLRGYQIRNALGLKENLFVIDREMDERGRTVAFVFTGRGWGHGVGMCQTGAAGLAKEGYSYTSILQKYYTNVKVQKMY